MSLFKNEKPRHHQERNATEREDRRDEEGPGREQNLAI
jgi:hypothetical protein